MMVVEYLLCMASGTISSLPLNDMRRYEFSSISILSRQEHRGIEKSGSYKECVACGHFPVDI